MSAADTIDTADYVIVGGGSAGCVLATRLSEDPSRTVILLEAGSRGGGPFVRMPAGAYRLLGNSRTDWMYRTEPDPSINGRQMTWNAGRLLGGGSAVNGMVYIRGARADYDAWEAAGCTGWGWRDLDPYFRKSEGFEGPPSQFHSEHGPLGVSAARIDHPLTAAFVDACVEHGTRRIDDYCSGDVDGAFVNFLTQRDGRRSSAEKAFLEAARRRPNLRVVTGATVDRVLFDGRTAIGVTYRDGGGVRQAMARGEVVVSAGTIQSPAVLMRSGIGPAAALRGHGIDVLAGRDEVGRNLQEHASFPLSYFVNVPTLNTMMGPLSIAKGLFDFVRSGRGLMTAGPVSAMATLRSSSDLDQPDIKLQFSPMCFDVARRKPHRRAGISVFVNVASPRSRGEIRLRSADPADAPVIDHRLLGDPADVTAFVQGLKQVTRLLEGTRFARYLSGPNIPHATPTDDAGWEQALKTYVSIGFHSVATCRMGADAASVVDPQLKVRGVDRLRVADASIMPILSYANTNAPAIMVGEKASDLIREDAR